MQRKLIGGVFLCITVLATMTAHARGTPTGAPASSVQAAAYGVLPLSLEPNVGQTVAGVDFLAHGSGFTLALTAGSTALGLQRGTPAVRSAAPSPGATTGLQLQLLGANPQARGAGEVPLPGTVNYFLGNDPVKWRTGIATYARVRYRNVYPGVDLIYYGRQGQVEYDFELAPGVDPAQVRLGFAGSTGLTIDGHGALVVRLPGGEVRQQRPVLYQELSGERRSVGGGYLLRAGGQVGFAVGAYDASRPLVIDPVLVYSTYLGGSVGTGGSGIAVDGAGNAYVTGRTASLDFPTKNPLQPANSTTGEYGTNAFVAKLNPTGSALVYSTYLGGSGIDSGSGIAVDGAGNAYVTGGTDSPDFPTMNPLQAALGGQRSAFVAKLNPTGSALVYSTYLGGTGIDSGSGIAVDGAGNAYVIGTTLSADFPTMNPLQAALGRSENANVARLNAKLGGQRSAYVAKLNPTGSALVYSTYLGGSGIDTGQGIAVDGAGNAYVTGGTDSPDFPTANPLQPVYGGHQDAYVAKLNATGSALVYSTYLGGSSIDGGVGIAVDGAGDAYVTGATYSVDFPTANPLQAARGGMSDNAFVAKLNPSGSAVVYSTYLGGSHGDFGSGIAVDGAGNAYVIGTTMSADFPTANPLQPALGRSVSAFVAKLNATGSALVYSTYLRGGGINGGVGIAVDGAGNAYVTGVTLSTDFPTMNPLQAAPTETGMGFSDAFVAKLTDGGATSSVSSPQTGAGTVQPANTSPGSPSEISSNNPTP